MQNDELKTIIEQTKKEFNSIIANGFDKENNEIYKKYNNFYNKIIDDFFKHFFENVREKYRHIFIINMFVALSLPFAEKVVFKSGRYKYDLRIHVLVALYSASGKSYMEHSVLESAKQLGLDVSTSTSEHIQAFIGKVKTSQYKPNEHSIEYNENVMNVFREKGTQKFYEVDITTGIFRYDLWTSSEASNLIDISKVGRTSKDGILIFKFLCDACDTLGTKPIRKEITDSKATLSYHSHTIFNLYMQMQKPHPEYYEQGVYRRIPAITGPKLNLEFEDEVSGMFIDGEDTKPTFFYDMLKELKSKSEKISFTKKYNSLGNWEKYQRKILVEESKNENKKDNKKPIKKEYKYVEKNINVGSNYDDWDIEEYSDIDLSPQALITIQLYINHFLDEQEEIYQVYIKKFKEYAKTPLRNFFVKFTVLLKLAYVMYDRKETPSKIEVENEIVHLLASDIKKIAKSMFIHFKENFNVAKSLELNNNQMAIIKKLQQADATNEERKLPRLVLESHFTSTTGKGKSTFTTNLSILKEKEIIIEVTSNVALKDRKKGEAIKWFYLDQSKLV